MKEEAIDIESYLSQDGKMKARLKAPLMLRVYADTCMLNSPTHCMLIFMMTAPK